MKPTFFYSKILLCGVLVLFGLNACQDKCTQTIQQRISQNQFISLDALRAGVSIKTAQVLEKPGKIYVKDNYLFINEIKKGIHIIDNSDPKNPKFLSFVSIPGNADIAVKDNTLYADSYSDLVTFDITNPQQVKIGKRVENVFTYGTIDGLWWSLNPQQNGINDTYYVLSTTSTSVDCDPTSSNNWWGPVFFSAASSGDKVSNPSGSGTGGSMARFAVVNNYLYTVSNSDMQLFDIQTPASPKTSTKINMGWGIETIFPYKDKLFIGSTTGMFIYDNVNPQKPTLLSQVNHFRACDPVVVSGNYAYVTLRTNNSGRCGAASQNQLDVIDISNIGFPSLAKVYPMDSPYGLGIDNATLFICEGTNGLKTFDATKPLDLSLLAHFKSINSYDVIPLKGTLLMIGKDGLYQFDYNDPKNLKLLSVIPVSANS